ncbi:hypothetical protein FRC07_006610 [Ceratobasidium sp. 392]|nr:hypothetical protein FRC07_006610 [Ceratobasidium sp. 392]
MIRLPSTSRANQQRPQPPPEDEYNAYLAQMRASGISPSTMPSAAHSARSLEQHPNARTLDDGNQHCGVFEPQAPPRSYSNLVPRLSKDQALHRGLEYPQSEVIPLPILEQFTPSPERPANTYAFVPTVPGPLSVPVLAPEFQQSLAYSRSPASVIPSTLPSHRELKLSPESMQGNAFASTDPFIASSGRSDDWARQPIEAPVPSPGPAPTNDFEEDRPHASSGYLGGPSTGGFSERSTEPDVFYVRKNDVAAGMSSRAQSRAKSEHKRTLLRSLTPPPTLTPPNKRLRQIVAVDEEIDTDSETTEPAASANKRPPGKPELLMRELANKDQIIDSLLRQLHNSFDQPESNNPNHSPTPTDQANTNPLVVPNVDPITITPTSERRNQKRTYPPPERESDAAITSTMTAPEIVACLTDRGCTNITDQLDEASCSSFPVSCGGYGDVYRGTLKCGTKVAIKTMRIYATGVESDHQKSLKRLLGLVEFREQLGMVSKWEANGNLSEYIQRRPETDRIQMSIQLADGLSYLHETGIIHGDLKASNVLISSEGVPLLSDFGNSTLQEYTLMFTTTSTKNGLSYRWASPELLEGLGRHSAAADVYALGMTILETITGQVPWFGMLETAVAIAVILKKKCPERPYKYIPDDYRPSSMQMQTFSSTGLTAPGETTITDASGADMDYEDQHDMLAAMYALQDQSWLDNCLLPKFKADFAGDGTNSSSGV